MLWGQGCYFSSNQYSVQSVIDLLFTYLVITVIFMAFHYASMPESYFLYATFIQHRQRRIQGGGEARASLAPLFFAISCCFPCNHFEELQTVIRN